MTYTLHHGDCLEILPTLPDCSVDSVVTDPPYGLSFMGRKWDYDVPSEEIWRECLRVLKPGGHLLAFAGTRTQHRMAVRIEDAGFEIRDMIAWVYGSGFPKSLDVSKAIDKAAGVEREVIAVRTDGRGASPQKLNNHGEGDTGIGHADGSKQTYFETAPASIEAKQWQGWGTALKPAMEPITVARKPLEGTVAANVLKHGTGAINVDGCRVELNGDYKCRANGRPSQTGLPDNYDSLKANQPDHLGRWPANFTHDGSDEVERLLGDAARFFYTAKASKQDRDEGCEGMEAGVCARSNQAQAEANRGNTVESEQGSFNKARLARNHHPTVKPTDLMRYLCRLITPSGGIVLDPFTGSGSTGKAAMLEGFGFIGIEREAEYIEIARARIERAKQKIDEGGRQLTFQFPQE